MRKPIPGASRALDASPTIVSCQSVTASKHPLRLIERFRSCFARTALGTINHSLLSIEALRNRGIDILGIAFVGDENVDTENSICKIGQIRRLGRLPWLSPLSADTLQTAFEASFSRDDFKP